MDKDYFIEEIIELEKRLKEQGLTADDIERMEVDACYLVKLEDINKSREAYINALYQIANAELN